MRSAPGAGSEGVQGREAAAAPGSRNPCPPRCQQTASGKKIGGLLYVANCSRKYIFFSLGKIQVIITSKGSAFKLKKKTVCACILPPSSAGEAGEKKRRRSRPPAWPRGRTAGSRCGSCACCGTCIGVLCIGVWAPSQRLGDRPGSARSQPTPDSRGPSVLLHSPRTLYKHRTIRVAIVCIKKSQSHFVSVGNICTYHCPSFDSEHLFSRLPFEFQLQGSANE